MPRIIFVVSPCAIEKQSHRLRMAIKSPVRVQVVNAMTFQGRNGNPAGVVLEASGLSPADRQKIAADGGYSETAFLEKSTDGKYRLDFYTPTRPIKYCGHATIATFALLKMQGLETRDQVEVVISNTALKIFYEGDRVLMEQKKPKYESLEAEHFAQILESIQIEEAQLDPEFRPQIVDTGNRFALISVNEVSDLANLKVDLQKISKLSEKLGLIGYYVFVRTPNQEQAATTRMFAPFYGIPEESATGMAAGPLAAALVDVLKLPSKTIRILQGEWMTPSQPSEIIATLQIENSKVESLKVGGAARTQE